MQDDIPVYEGHQFVEHLDKLCDDQGMYIDRYYENTTAWRVIRINGEDLARLAALDSSYHVVCLAARDFAMKFFQELEHLHFCGEDNNLFKMTYYRWLGAMWLIGTVPYIRRAACEMVARNQSLRLYNAHPFIIDHGSIRSVANLRAKPPQAGVIHEFPMGGHRVFCIEPNLPGGPRVGGIATLEDRPYKPTVIDDLLRKQ